MCVSGKFVSVNFDKKLGIWDKIPTFAIFMAPSLTLELTFEYFMDERRYAVFRSIALKVMIKSYWFIFVGRVDSETAEGHRVCNYQYLDSPFMCLYSKIKSKV